ncbi:MAG TPA: NAD(P)-dependent oxidoreductase, partial [Burkholderiales bacterium]|nr:NAD(P)-dependent oxidoreductase [Burkholderiales bacterium]
DRIGVIGLGIMGGAMAEALLEAGHAVTGYDIRIAARNRLAKAGGKPASSARAVATQADIVITALATLSSFDDVMAQIAEAPRNPRASHRIVIETSTLPLEDKLRARKRLAAAGWAMLDCPISGTAVRMKQGAWTIFVSGSAAAAKRAKPVLAVFTRNAPYVGAFGNGTKMKFIANHFVAILNVAVGESLTFARAMGLDARAVWAQFAENPVIGTGVYKLRGKQMVERVYQPATMKVEVWQKDMQVIGDMARAVGCPTPLFSACAPVYNAAIAHGLAEHDTASVGEVLGEMAGIAMKSRARSRAR